MVAQMARLSREARLPASSACEGSTDADLVARSRAGSRTAFAELVRRHEGWLLNLLDHLVASKADSEDLAQDVLITAWQRLGDLREGQAFGAWLRRIAVNRAIAFRRQQARHNAHALFEQMMPTDDAVEPLAVRQLLLRMKPEFAAVLVLKEIQGLSYEEIAETLRLPIGTVRSRLHYAREAFRRMWER